MQHKIVNGLHCIIDKRGRVNVYTEKEYTHLQWWKKIQIKYNLKFKR